MLHITELTRGSRRHQGYHPSVITYEPYITTDSTERNIKTYIESEMADIRQANGTLNLGSDWPGAAKISALEACQGPLHLALRCVCTYQQILRSETKP